MPGMEDMRAMQMPMGQPQAQDEPSPEYTSEDMRQHGAVQALLAQKGTILWLLHQEKVAANAPVILTNTLLMIMEDYGFAEVKPPDEEESKSVR